MSRLSLIILVVASISAMALSANDESKQSKLTPSYKKANSNSPVKAPRYRMKVKSAPTNPELNATVSTVSFDGSNVTFAGPNLISDVSCSEEKKSGLKGKSLPSNGVNSSEIAKSISNGPIDEGTNDSSDSSCTQDITNGRRNQRTARPSSTMIGSRTLPKIDNSSVVVFPNGGESEPRTVDEFGRLVGQISAAKPGKRLVGFANEPKIPLDSTVNATTTLDNQRRRASPPSNKDIYRNGTTVIAPMVSSTVAVPVEMIPVEVVPVDVIPVVRMTGDISLMSTSSLVPVTLPDGSIIMASNDLLSAPQTPIQLESANRNTADALNLMQRAYSATPLPAASNMTNATMVQGSNSTMNSTDSIKMKNSSTVLNVGSRSRGASPSQLYEPRQK